ncbi:MAG: amidohydrolase family protein [Planctomycetota bacterium]
MRCRSSCAVVAFALWSVVLPVVDLGAQVDLKARGEIVITGAQVLDPTGEGFVAGRAVWIDRGRIRAVAPLSELAEIAADCERIDGRGGFVIPGLIDLHSHLLLRPYDEVSWNDQVLKESLPLRTIRATVAARATLAAGFTTLRELGTEGAGYADVALRDAIAEGLIPGPRVFAATRALVATGCYGPSGFAPEIALPKGAQVADGPVALRVATREQIAAGADWIKVYADYRRRPGGPSSPTFSLDELRAIVDEATSAGVPVAAHAVTTEAIRRAVSAGVRTIEHGYHADDATLEQMREAGVVLCPTLTASDAIARYNGWDGRGPEPPRVRVARVMFQRALRSGVTIACGSDVGVFRHGDNAREIELMAEWGMGPKRALQAATAVAAAVLGKAAELGQVREGFRADVVLLRQDPHRDAKALRTVALVVKDGVVVHRAPD